MRAPFANSCAGEWDVKETDLLVDFRTSRLALDRSLCHGEEKRERERFMAGDAEDKGGRRRGGGCAERGLG